MQNELRPCVFLSCGKIVKGLFHCWSISQGDCISHTHKGETVALVENEYGTILERKPNEVWFIDSQKEMDKFDNLFKERGVDNAE